MWEYAEALTVAVGEPVGTRPPGPWVGLGDGTLSELKADFYDEWVSSNGSSDQVFETGFKTVTDYLDLIFVPVVALVGLAGNLVSVVVFLCTYLRRQSSSVYLAALGVADSAFLLCVLLSWARRLGLSVYTLDGWCQTFIYVTYLSSFLSVWFVVSFTCERYIVIMFPLMRARLCTTRRAKMVVGGFSAGAAVLYSFGPWTSGVTQITEWPDGGLTCGPLPQYIAVVDVFYHIDTCVTLILPFLAILGMNLRITLKVVQFYRAKKGGPPASPAHRQPASAQESPRRASLSALQRDPPSAAEHRRQLVVKYSGLRQVNLNSRTRVMYTRTQVRVTKMLLTVSTLFLLLNLPRHTTRAYSMVRRLLDAQYSQSHTCLLWDRLFQFLYYLHFSVNLFLYTVLNVSFRKACLWLLAKLRHALAHAIMGLLHHCARPPTRRPPPPQARAELTHFL